MQNVELGKCSEFWKPLLKTQKQELKCLKGEVSALIVLHKSIQLHSLPYSNYSNQILVITELGNFLLSIFHSSSPAFYLRRLCVLCNGEECVMCFHCTLSHFRWNTRDENGGHMNRLNTIDTMHHFLLQEKMSLAKPGTMHIWSDNPSSSIISVLSIHLFLCKFNESTELYILFILGRD